MEWRVLEVLDPWGQRREDLRFAMLSRQIAQWLGVKPKDGGELKVKVEDLALTFADGEEPVQQSAGQIERHMLAWAKAFNATAKKGEPRVIVRSRSAGAAKA